ncbi:MAG: aspartyl/glutamyl-tRNA(Asn/Gln) amidotransferase subunit C [Campylobacteraceae bacterium 4484_4]|nr:MAG: aspartyl/glutamyl-tRNA(Asn/Gln) amidotransferase subunit C [Campylobacteraceae bacterium 4484_4]
MKIDDRLLTKLEKLSMISIAEEKRAQIVNEIGEIVDFVENLSELDLENEEASFSTISGGTPFREDSPRNDPKIIEEVLKNAPQSKGGFFVVPKIIE